MHNWLIGIKTSQFHIGYSYDFTISNLIGSTAGAHEISLIYEFNNLSLGAAEETDQGNTLSGILTIFIHLLSSPLNLHNITLNFISFKLVQFIYLFIFAPY